MHASRFCCCYLRYLRIRNAVGTLHLVNFRGQECLGRDEAFVFRSHKRARQLYPILRTGRNLTLKALGRGKISES
jgi:hypothetical protein